MEAGPMEKKLVAPLDSPARTSTSDEPTTVPDLDLPAADATVHVLERPQPDPGIDVRGRRYRMATADGFIAIWNLRTGEQVATFMEDAGDTAAERFAELEANGPLANSLARAGAVLAGSWYVVVVIVLGALTVAYLRFADGGLTPTAAGERPPAVAARAAAPVDEAGLAVATGLTRRRLLPKAPSSDDAKQTKPDRRAAGRSRSDATVPAPTTPPSVAPDSAGKTQPHSQPGGNGGGSDPNDHTSPPPTTPAPTTPPTPQPTPDDPSVDPATP
jgi:hypothetical protein